MLCLFIKSKLLYFCRMRIFLATALDMCFKIYDRKLKLIESIRHGERSILAMEFDNETGFLLISGASGMY